MILTIFRCYFKRGDIKIFDLGLAKEIPKDAPPGAVFAFTGMCGTPRYMAPEGMSSQLLEYPITKAS